MKKKILATLIWLFAPLAVIHADWNTGLSEAGTFDLPDAEVYDIIIGVLLWLLMLFTVLAVLAFVVAGVMFLTAGANADNAEKAKDMVKYSIIGIVAGLSGYIIINLINSILLGDGGGGGGGYYNYW